jgi:hypothetical protein
MLADAFAESIIAAGGDPIPWPLDDRLATATARLADQYRSADWTWRR